jgi:hypothetical protein
MIGQHAIGWRRLGTGAALAAGLWLLGTSAEAAPQILGLVASNGDPTQLRCEGGLCSGFVSSFCLQAGRPSPKIVSEYHLAPGGGLTLIARRADGSSIRLPGEDLVAVRSRIGFSSVTLSLPETRLKALGAVSAAIEVAPLTSVLPVPVAGDGNPQTAADIAYATGVQRRIAQRSFETPGEASDAARLAALVINSLPPDEPKAEASRQAIWGKALMLAAGSPLDPQGIAEAARMYRNCGAAVDAHTAVTLKSCMEMHQAGLIGALELDQPTGAPVRSVDDGAGGS